MAGSLFTDALGGGVRVGGTLADLFQQGQERRQLGELAKLIGMGDYQGAGAGLVGLGRVAEGVNTVQIPWRQEQQRLQQDFQNQQFMDNRDFRRQQFDWQRQQAQENNAFRERSFEADQGYRGATLGLKQAELAQDIAEASKPDFNDEHALSKDFQSVTKDYRDVRDAYARVQVSAADPSAAGDLAMIFNFMKMLDPGSTVREGEFATAQNAAGVPQRILAAYNNLMNGTRLTPEQRRDFEGKARALFSSQEGQYNKTKDEYGRRARAYGFDPVRVLSDFAPVGQVAPPPPMQGPRSAATNGKPIVEPVDEIEDLVNRYAD